MSTNPIFVIGHPKSGTSLMTALLDSHPELLVLSEESDFYLNIWPLANLLNLEWRRSQEEKVQLMMDHITGVSHIKNYFRGSVEKDISGNFDYNHFANKFFREKLFEEIKNIRKYDRRQLLLSILKAYGEAYEKTFKTSSLSKPWVEKTAKNTWHIDAMLEDFPDARFIFIYRDPRDNYVSFKKKLGEEMNAIRFAKSWNEASMNSEKIKKDQIIFIKYEDLVQQPEAEMKAIASFLGIQYLDMLTQPSKMGIAWKGNSMFGVKSKSVSTENFGRYKKIISQEDLAILESFCHQQMKEMEYPLDTDSKNFEKIRDTHQEEYDEWLPFGYTDKKPLRRQLGELRINLMGKRPKG